MGKSIQLPPGELDLSVVIINYRMRHLLEGCLRSLFSQTFHCSFEVVLVNKPSDDGTEQLVCDHFPQVRLVTHQKFGIAEMRNRGILTARGHFFLMLDADTNVFPQAFDTMVEFMNQHPEAAGAGGKTIRADGSLEYSVRRFYSIPAILSRRTPLGSLFPHNPWERRHLMLDQDHDRVFEIDWMAGACFLMRRQAVEHIGLFDTTFYFGFEDVDWCFRAKKLGWKLFYIPQPCIIHFVQRSSARLGKMSWEHLKSGLRFYAKHYLKAGTHKD